MVLRKSASTSLYSSDEDTRGTLWRSSEMSYFPLKHTHRHTAITLICVTSCISYFERMHTSYLVSCLRELGFLPVVRYSSQTCRSSRLTVFTTHILIISGCGHKPPLHARIFFEHPPQSALLNVSCRDKSGPPSHELHGPILNVYLCHI